MSPSSPRIGPLAVGLILSACAPADAPGDGAAPGRAEARGEGAEREGARGSAAVTLEDRLAGDWSGENATRGRMSFSFQPDGKVVWIVYPPSGPDTLHADYAATAVDGRLEIDLSGFEAGPLAGLDMYGLATFDGPDSLRIDFEPGPPGDSSLRPGDFSSTDVLTLVRSSLSNN